MPRLWHRLDQTKINEHGLTIEAAIGSLRDADKDSLSGAGFIQVRVSNHSHASGVMLEVEARGEDIRWETQRDTNSRLHSFLDESTNTALAVFEVELSGVL